MYLLMLAMDCATTLCTTGRHIDSHWVGTYRRQMGIDALGTYHSLLDSSRHPATFQAVQAFNNASASFAGQSQVQDG